MKKIISILTGLLFLAFSFNAEAQTQPPADYFPGKWNLLIKGPNGDRKMVLVLEKNEGKITGVMQDTVGTEISKISNVQLKEKDINFDFSTSGREITIVLSKKEDDHATGNAMGSYDLVAERVKTTKQ